MRRERILSLDLLRGLFLVIIFVDHLSWQPSLFFQFITSNTGLYASAAEGFFMISGVLVGYIYGPRILSSRKNTIFRILKRAGLLYILAVIFTLLYSFWSLSLDAPNPLFALWPGDIPSMIINTFTLNYNYGWTDYLSKYALFMLFSPIALLLIAKKKWWIVAIASASIWLFLRKDFTFISAASWQLVFTSGILVGYYLPRIEKIVKSASTKFSFPFLKAIVITGITSYILIAVWSSIVPFVIFHFLSGLPTEIAEFITKIENFRANTLVYFVKDSIELSRYLIGTLWFATLYILFRRYEDILNRMTRGLLLNLGQNSLFVYCLQAFVLFTLDVVFRPPHPNILLNTFVGVAGVAFIIVVTKYRNHIPYLKGKSI